MIDEVREGCLIEEVWHRLKEKVLAAAEKGRGKGKNEGEVRGMVERSEG